MTMNTKQSIILCQECHICQTPGCMHDKSDEKHAAKEMTTQDRLKEMQDFLKKANELFEEGMYDLSSALYKKALLYYEYCCLDSNKYEQIQADKLYGKCAINLVLSFMNLENFRDGLELLNEIFASNQQTANVMFLKAQHYRILDDFELATASLEKAAGLLGNDNNLIRKEKNNSGRKKIQV